jgi:hypothetical protein
MKTLTPEQIYRRAQRVIVDLHKIHSAVSENKLRPLVGLGGLGAHDMALIAALVNAETHLATHFPPLSVTFVKKPAKKAKRG